MKRYIPLLLSSVFAIVADGAVAHPYLPLEKGRITVLEYRFHVEGAKMEELKKDVRGEMTTRFEDLEEKSGKKYLRQRTSYKNIPYMTEDQAGWRREENGNVYLGIDTPGKWKETLELPADVSVGSEWDYNDGVQSKRKITRLLDLTLTTGETVKDCLEVTRSIVKNEKLKTVVNINYYCRDKGDAGSTFRQPSPLGEYITETTPIRFSGPQ